MSCKIAGTHELKVNRGCGSGRDNQHHPEGVGLVPEGCMRGRVSHVGCPGTTSRRNYRVQPPGQLEQQRDERPAPQLFKNWHPLSDNRVCRPNFTKSAGSRRAFQLVMGDSTLALILLFLFAAPQADAKVCRFLPPMDDQAAVSLQSLTLEYDGTWAVSTGDRYTCLSEG